MNKEDVFRFYNELERDVAKLVKENLEQKIENLDEGFFKEIGCLLSYPQADKYQKIKYLLIEKLELNKKS